MWCARSATTRSRTPRGRSIRGATSAPWRRRSSWRTWTWRSGGCGDRVGLQPFATRRQTALWAIAAKVEEEIAALDAGDARAFLDDLGLLEPAKDRLIRAAFGLLGLIQFFTVGEDECRAWPVRRGATAPRAAGAIHSDFEKGFIRAEVVSYDDLLATGSIAAAP